MNKLEYIYISMKLTCKSITTFYGEKNENEKKLHMCVRVCVCVCLSEAVLVNTAEPQPGFKHQTSGLPC